MFSEVIPLEIAILTKHFVSTIKLSILVHTPPALSAHPARHHELIQLRAGAVALKVQGETDRA